KKRRQGRRFLFALPPKLCYSPMGAGLAGAGDAKAMDRRHFIGLTGIAAALLDTSRAEAAPPLPGAAGKSAADFGVMPDVPADHSPALQKAIDELTAAGQPVVIPAGRYRAARLQLPSKAVLLGVPGLTVLNASQGVPVFESLNAQD